MFFFILGQTVLFTHNMCSAAREHSVWKYTDSPLPTDYILYLVYITKAELLAADRIKPTLHLVLTCDMNFQTLCAERLRELCVEVQP